MNKAVSELYLANQVTLTRPLTKTINLAIFFSNCKVNISLQSCLSMWMRHSKNGFRRSAMLYPFISCFSIFNDVRTMLLYLTPYDWYIYRCETRPFRLNFHPSSSSPPQLLRHNLKQITCSSQEKAGKQDMSFFLKLSCTVNGTIYLVINRPK